MRFNVYVGQQKILSIPGGRQTGWRQVNLNVPVIANASEVGK